MIKQNHECYVSLEVAKLLKEAGFDWKITSCYNCYGIPILSTDMGVYRNYNEDENIISAPTLDVAQRWLREVKGMEFDICWHMNLYNQYKYAYAIKVKSIRKCLDKGKEIEVPSMDCLNAETCLDTYEEAQEAGEKKALELILEKEE